MGFEMNIAVRKTYPGNAAVPSGDAARAGLNKTIAVAAASKLCFMAVMLPGDNP